MKTNFLFKLIFIAIFLSAFQANGLAQINPTDPLNPPTPPNADCTDSQVIISYPSNNSTVSQIVNVQVDVTGTCEPLNVFLEYSFNQEWQLIDFDQQRPFSFNWDTTNLENGDYLLKATAVFETTNLSSSQIINVNVDNSTGTSSIQITNVFPQENSIVASSSTEIGAFYASSSPLNQSSTLLEVIAPDSTALTYSNNVNYAENRFFVIVENLQEGLYHVRLHIENVDGVAAEKNWEFTVLSSEPFNQTNQNYPPVFNDFSLGTLYHHSSSQISLNQFVQDEDQPSITFEVLSESGIGCEISGQSLAYETLQGFSGTAFCEISAQDNAGQTDSALASAIVNELALELQAFPQTGRAPLSVSFEASVIGGTQPYFFEWDFDGDGLFETSTQEISAANFEYSTAGQFNVIVKITDSLGRSAIKDIIIQVFSEQNNPPVVNDIEFSPKEIDESTVVTFTANAFDEDNDALSYYWDFGDGTQGEGIAVQHTFELSSLTARTQTFEVKLRVVDEYGASADKKISVVVKRAKLKIIVGKPASTQESRIKKNGEVEVLLWVVNENGELVSSSSIEGSPIATIEGQVIELELLKEGVFRGVFNPNFKTPNDTYLRVETTVAVGGVTHSAVVLKPVYFKPVELQATIQVFPQKIRVSSKIDKLNVSVVYPDNSKVTDAELKAMLKAPIIKSFKAVQQVDGKFIFSGIDYVVGKEDKQIEFSVEGQDKAGNFLEEQLVLKVEELNPLFNIEVIEPDQSKPAVFYYNLTSRVVVKVNSTKKDQLKDVSIYLEIDDLNFFEMMSYNKQIDAFEAFLSVPEKKQLNNDSLFFSVSGQSKIGGEQYSDSVSFPAALIETLDLVPLILIILAAFFAITLVYLVNSYISQKAKLRTVLEVERKNLIGLQKRLTFEFLKRHITEQEFKERLLRSQQELATVEERLGLKKGKNVINRDGIQ